MTSGSDKYAAQYPVTCRFSFSVSPERGKNGLKLRARCLHRAPARKTAFRRLPLHAALSALTVWRRSPSLAQCVFIALLHRPPAKSRFFPCSLQESRPRISALRRDSWRSQTAAHCFLPHRPFGLQREQLVFQLRHAVFDARELLCHSFRRSVRLGGLRRKGEAEFFRFCSMSRFT